MGHVILDLLEEVGSDGIESDQFICRFFLDFRLISIRL
jgi:hypothetical protein